MFTSLGSLLNRPFHRADFGKKIATAQLLSIAQTAIVVVLPDMHTSLTAKMLKDNVLTITCAFGADSQAVLFAADDILREVNRRAEGEVVKRVVVRME